MDYVCIVLYQYCYCHASRLLKLRVFTQGVCQVREFTLSLEKSGNLLTSQGISVKLGSLFLVTANGMKSITKFKKFLIASKFQEKD